MELRVRELARGADSIETFYRTHVTAIEEEFRSMGTSTALAREIAWAVAIESKTAGINPELMVAIIKVENPWLKPDTVSYAGAIGITQVMPFHAGRWGCGDDLRNIRTNVCSGTRIMAAYLNSQHGEANRRALLNYNGCVRTPGCERYADLVWRRTQFNDDQARVWASK